MNGHPLQYVDREMGYQSIKLSISLTKRDEAQMIRNEVFKSFFHIYNLKICKTYDLLSGTNDWLNCQGYYKFWKTWEMVRLCEELEKIWKIYKKIVYKVLLIEKYQNFHTLNFVPLSKELRIIRVWSLFSSIRVYRSPNFLLIVVEN